MEPGAARDRRYGINPFGRSGSKLAPIPIGVVHSYTCAPAQHCKGTPFRVIGNARHSWKSQMPMSPHLAAVRAKVGHDLLTLTASCVSVFDREGRQLLVLLADTGSWAVPGGAIDPDETPADAAVRECWEETGLLVKPKRLIGVYGGPEFRITYPNGDEVYYIIIAFEAEKIGGSYRADGSETLQLEYFPKAECEDLPMRPASRIITNHAFEMNNVAYFAPPTWTPKTG